MKHGEFFRLTRIAMAIAQRDSRNTAIMIPEGAVIELLNGPFDGVRPIGDTLEVNWTIIGKYVIAEPTPRTQTEAPRLGIYGYDVVPLRKAAPVNCTSNTHRTHPPVSFRRIS